MPRKKATVLVFAGHDPCGGAGISADIQAISAMGAHPATLITTLTVQNTRHVAKCTPISSTLLSEQLDTLLVDLSIDAIKIGLLGSLENACVIRDLIKSRPDIPVILDPIIHAGTGHTLTNDALLYFIQQELLPRTTVLTPNHLEAGILAYRTDRKQCADKILDKGVKHLLITGGHEDTAQIINHYYNELGEYTRFRWPRLAGEFHGSGCTLAASIAALIAQGMSVIQAISDAQNYTWQTLKNANIIGQGQLIPERTHHDVEKTT